MLHHGMSSMVCVGSQSIWLFVVPVFVASRSVSELEAHEPAMAFIPAVAFSFRQAAVHDEHMQQCPQTVWGRGSSVPAKAGRAASVSQAW